jgi:hypothetical protein
MKSHSLFGILTMSSMALLIIYTGIETQLPSGAQADPAANEKSKLALDRISLILRGTLATEAEKTQFKTSGSDLDSFMESIRKNNRYDLEKQLAWHYSEAIRIDRPVNVFELGGEKSPKVFLESRQGSPEAGRETIGADARLPYFSDASQLGVYALSGPKFFTQNTSTNAGPELQTALWCNSAAGAAVAEVKPWWSKDQSIKICASNVAACGGNSLPRCFPWTQYTQTDFNTNTLEDDFTPLLTSDFTLEPGYLIAKTITEEKPWDTVLTATASPISGTMEYFVNQDFGAGVYSQAPVGTYLDANEKSLLTRKNDPYDGSWRWVERGPNHAGVLTTPAFQQTFNGWRAKSNAAMEGFLCRKFVPPQGISPVANADQYELLKRPYCSSCHSVLEPMSDFFRRWENVGGRAYSYLSSNQNPPTGSYNGSTDSDLPGLARVFTSQEDFGTCAVKRAFSFVTGRELEPEEVATLLPKLVDTYQKSGKNIWKVMKEVAVSSSFLDKETLK